MVATLTAGCFMFSFIFAHPALYAIGEVQDFQAAQKLKTQENFLIPAEIGKITSGGYFGSDKIVINVQDLHCNAEVERNISGILSVLTKRYGVKKVFLEGASGRVDTSWLGNIKDKTLKKKLIEGMLNEGILTGTEYYSLTNEKSAEIDGLENREVHRENIKRLAEILKRQEFFQKKLAELKSDLFLIKAKYFHNHNKSFDRLLAKYKDGQIDTQKFYTLLLKYASKINESPNKYHGLFAIDLANYPNMTGFINLVNASRRLNYVNISNQLKAVIAQLKNRLSYADYKNLAEKTDNFSKINELFLGIQNLPKSFDTGFIKQYKDLSAFFDYLAKVQSINPIHLIKEERRLIEELRIGMSDDISEVEVSFLADFFNYFENYLTSKLSAEDYEYFTKRVEKFKFLWARYAFKNKIADLSGNFSLLNKYYEVNKERNNYFIGNVLGGLEKPIQKIEKIKDPAQNVLSAIQSLEKAQEIDIVVAGGFHTQGLEKLLAGRNISYLSVTPNIIKGTENSNRIFNEVIKEQAKMIASANSQIIPSQVTLASQIKMSLEVMAKIGIELNEANIKTFMDSFAPLSYIPKKTAENIEIDVQNENDLVSKVIVPLKPKSAVLQSNKIVDFAESLINAAISSWESLDTFLQRFGDLVRGDMYLSVILVAKWAAENGYMTGNGLIYEISVDEDAQKCIVAKESIKLEDLANFPEFLQKAIKEHSQLSNKEHYKEAQKTWTENIAKTIETKPAETKVNFYGKGKTISKPSQFQVPNKKVFEGYAKIMGTLNKFNEENQLIIRETLEKLESSFAAKGEMPIFKQALFNLEKLLTNEENISLYLLHLKVTRGKKTMQGCEEEIRNAAKGLIEINGEARQLLSRLKKFTEKQREQNENIGSAGQGKGCNCSKQLFRLRGANGQYLGKTTWPSGGFRHEGENTQQNK